MIRWSTIAVIIGLLLAGIAYDRVDTAPGEALPSETAARITPQLVNPPRLSSSWYCPVGTTVRGGFATHRVAVSNVGSTPTLVSVDTLTAEGAGPGLRFELGPLSTEFIDVRSLIEATIDDDDNPDTDEVPNTLGLAVGVAVEFVGGEGVVGHQVITAHGVAEGPCSSEASNQWFFASGSTTRDAKDFIVLLNPSLDDVVFQAEFQIDGRTRAPGDLKAGVVPARSVRVIDVGEFVAREELIAASITTVDGLLVAERLQTFDGQLGPLGASLQLGVIDPSTAWSFPAGRVTADGDSVIVVSNPGTEIVEVDILLDPIDSTDRQFYGLVAIPLTVNPGRSAQYNLADLALQVGIPLPYELGVRVTSVNEQPFVAERWQLVPGIDRTLIGAGGEDARILPQQDGDDTEIPVEDGEEPLETDVIYEQATPTKGAATSRGSELPSTRWVIPWVSLTPDAGTVIVVTGAGGDDDAQIEARLMLGGTLQTPVRGVVAPDGRTIMVINGAVDGAPVVITSDQPIWVEAQVSIVDERFDVVPAVPTRGR